MFEVAPATLLAPMEGVCSPWTRQLLASYGPIGLVCTPFIRITEQRPSASYLESRIRAERVDNFSMQLLGMNASCLAEAARILCDLGVRFIDLNFGCPSKQVMRKGAGAALLAHRETIGEIVGRVRRAHRGILSVKMRGGVGHLDDTLELAATVADAGADFLVLHPRSGRQGYDGIADWSWIRRVKTQLRISVVGNGDCWYASDAIRLMQWSACDAVMIGRPSLRNPWIFRQVAELNRGQQPFCPTGSDVRAHLGRLAGLLEEELGRERAVGALKEHFKYLLRAIPERERVELGRAVLRASSCSAVLRATAPIERMQYLDLAAESTEPLERSAAVGSGE